MNKPWTESEVAAAVADYFAMLSLELTGQKYNKSEHRRDLQKRLNNRSDGSIELKHQNISAVLIEMGIPYINGYKPRSNYQGILSGAVSLILKENPEFQELFKENSETVPSILTIPTVTDFLAAMEDPPSEVASRHGAVSEQPAIYNSAGVNWLEREAQNQELGEAGEHFVLNFEKARLIHAGKDSLADRIEQVSVTIGPSAGYDIRSFEVNGTDRLIEAKTTKHGKNTPFFFSANELRFSKENSSRYHLYRLFRFGIESKMFALPGYLRDNCNIEASQFTARPKRIQQDIPMHTGR